MVNFDVNKTKCQNCPHQPDCKPCNAMFIEQLQAVRAVINPSFRPNSDPDGRMAQGYKMMDDLIQNWIIGRYSPVVYPGNEIVDNK